MNSNGAVAFSASIRPHDDRFFSPSAPDDWGVWSGDSGGLSLVVSTATPSPVAGLTFEEFSDALIDDAGGVAFVSVVRKPTSGGGGGAINSTIWTNRSGTLDLVARKDDLPGREGGIFSAVPQRFDLFGINRAGTITFRTTLHQTSPFPSRYGVWVSQAGGPTTLLAKEGLPAPAPLGTYMDLRPSDDDGPLLNDAGQLIFNATGTPVTGAILKATATSPPELLATGSTSIVGTPLSVFDPSTTGFNNEGAVLNGSLIGGGTLPSSGLTLWRDGGYRLIARTHGPAPGMGPDAKFVIVGGQLGRFSLLSGTGEAVFVGIAEGTGITSTNSEGLWFGTPESLQLVLREGDAAPGLPAGTQFSQFESITTNTNGDLVFAAYLRGGGVVGNNYSIWSRTAAGELRLVAREGDLVDVDPGPAQLLKAIDDRDNISLAMHWGSGGEDGRPTSFGADGTIAMMLEFTDGTRGVFTTRVPDPAGGTSVLAITGILAMAGRRRSGRRRTRSSDPVS